MGTIFDTDRLSYHRIANGIYFLDIPYAFSERIILYRHDQGLATPQNAYFLANFERQIDSFVLLYILVLCAKQAIRILLSLCRWKNDVE